MNALTTKLEMRITTSAFIKAMVLKCLPETVFNIDVDVAPWAINLIPLKLQGYGVSIFIENGKCIISIHYDNGLQFSYWTLPDLPDGETLLLEDFAKRWIENMRSEWC